MKSMLTRMLAILIVGALWLMLSDEGQSEPPKAEVPPPQLSFPIIPGHGGVVAIPQPAEPPQSGAKAVFDLTADAKPAEANKGLERVARFLNLYGAAGLEAKDVKLALVLHGEATKAALADEAFRQRFGVAQNPNLPLIRLLKKAGVEVFVCGQALAYKGFPREQVAGEVRIAAAALTVVVNRQTDGYAYVPVN